VITSYSLGTLCALFNTTAAVLMTLGFIAIKQKRRERHKRLMLSAFMASCSFLAVYVTRILRFGDAHFGGGGALKLFYLSLLASHVLLALCTAPMVITTLVLALRGRYATHKKLARITLPIWAYVSVTGVIVYLMLYHWPH
jgi:putative membrane protein